eukprot:gene7240-8008_t
MVALSWDWLSWSLLGPRSEQWRLFWSFRTCISTAVFCFLFLFMPTRKHLLKFTDAGFVAFVTVLVKDVTLGASIMNAWACILGTFTASIIIQIIFAILGSIYVEPSHCPHEVQLLLLLGTVFIMQYAELQLMGKKLGVSLLALCLLSYRTYDETTMGIWKYFVSVLIGCACALVGALLPLPLPRLAGEEVRSRLDYYCQTICALLREEVTAWLHEPVKNHILEGMRTTTHWLHPLSQSSTSSSSYVNVQSPQLIKRLEKVLLTPAQQRWKTLRLCITACIAFKRSHRYHIGWLANPSFRAKNRHLRSEMVAYLLQQIDSLRKRNNEALFEPFSRGLARTAFAHSLRLIHTLLTILLHFERQISALESRPQHHDIFLRFFQQPDFRRALFVLVDRVCAALYAVFHLHGSTAPHNFGGGHTGGSKRKHHSSKQHSSGGSSSSRWWRWFLLETYLQPQQEEEEETQEDDDEVDIEEKFEKLQSLADCMCRMVKAREDLDEVYFSLRNYVYYGISLASQPCCPLPEGEEEGDSSKDNCSILVDCPPIFADVSFTLNTSLFLLDTLVDHLLYFHRKDSLALYKEEATLYQRHEEKKRRRQVAKQRLLLQFGGGGGGGRETLTAKSKSRRRRGWVERLQTRSASCYTSSVLYLSTLSLSCSSLLRDLLPSQMPLFCLHYEGVSRRWRWRITPAIHARLLSALMVSIAMTIAGVYGIYAKRPQISLTSFTIAYLAGGSASGINIMTCINRSIGTVISCIYVIFVVFIYNAYKDSVSSSDALYLSEAWVLGATSVVFQLPATYIRTYPLYSYSGTVAGFTAALLLIDINLSTNVAIDRILDTAVGVLIYASLELALFAQSSESVLLADLGNFLKGIDVHFSQFHSHFQSLESRAGGGGRSRGTAGGGGGGSGGSGSGIEEYDRKLSLVQSLSPTSSIELDRLASLIGRQRELLPFYKSEPRLLLAPVLPDRLLQEVIYYEDQALLSLQMMQFVVNKVYLSSRRWRRRRYFDVLQLYYDLGHVIRYTKKLLRDVEREEDQVLVAEDRKGEDGVAGGGGGGYHKLIHSQGDIELGLTNTRKPSVVLPPSETTPTKEGGGGGEVAVREEEVVVDEEEVVQKVEQLQQEEDRKYLQDLRDMYRRRRSSIASEEAALRGAGGGGAGSGAVEVAEIETDAIELSHLQGSSANLPLDLGLAGLHDDGEGGGGGVDHHMEAMEHSSPSTSHLPRGDRHRSIIGSTLPDFEAMLLPLQPQFMKVEQLVSSALAFLTHALSQLRKADCIGPQSYYGQYEAFLRRYASSSTATSSAPHVLAQINHIRFLHQIEEAQLLPSITNPDPQLEEEEKKRESIRFHSLYFGEMRGEEVDRLFQDFEDTVNSLQEAVIKPLETVQQQLSQQQSVLAIPPASTHPHRRGPSLTPAARVAIHRMKQITSNDEMKLVCTLLESTQQLIGALQGLAKTISRLQAFRDISVTQNGT